MRINDINRLNMLQSYQKATGKVQNSHQVKGQMKDKVEISTEAQEKLKQTSGELVAREERLNGLKEQISTGKYTVNSDKIAEKLLAYWRNQPGQKD